MEDVPLYARMADDGSAKRLKPFEDGADMQSKQSLPGLLPKK